MKNAYEEFNRTFFESAFDKFYRQGTKAALKYYGDKVVLEISSGKVAEFTLCDFGYKDHYTGYKVLVVSKDGNKISECDFKFPDYFDYLLDDPSASYRAWYNRKELGWYIHVPPVKEIEELAFKMLDWTRNYV